jgi:hypothetical protein
MKPLPRAVNVLFMTAFIVAGIILIVIAFAGMIEISRAAGVYFGIIESSTSASSHVSATLSMSLKGIELLLLAPMPLLILKGMERHLKDFLHPSEQHSLQSRHTFGSLKATMISLMVAILAADLVDKALSVDGLSYEAAATRIAAIAVIGGYYCLIRK